MDDEKYFTYDDSNIQGNDDYYTSEKLKCPDSVQIVKFEAVNSVIYINKCLEKLLLPFIHEHHPDSNYIFWPDLAGCHYSKQTVAWIDENLKIVPK